MRYCYKDKKTGRPVCNLKEPLDKEASKGYVSMTEEEWNEWEAEQEAARQAAYNAPEAVAAREKAKAIATKKRELAATDYVVIKIAESDDPEEIAALREEYATVIAHRKQLRAEINALEEGE